MSRYTIQEVNQIPTDDLIDFIEDSGYELDSEMTELEIRLEAIHILADQNRLDPKDQIALSIPYFDQIYISEGGKLLPSLFHLGVDLTPGLSLLTTVERLTKRI